MDNQNMPEWMQDEAVQKIDKQKLDFLNDCYAAIRGKDKKALMPLLGIKIKEARKNGLQFTPDELNIAVAAIKKRGNEETNQQIDEILKKGRS